MNRLVTAGLILSLGSCVIGALQATGTRLHNQEAQVRREWIVQAQRLARSQTQFKAVEQTMHDLRLAAPATLAALISPRQRVLYSLAGTTNPDAAQSEALLDDFGFNWNSQKDYLFMSKQALAHLTYRAASHLKVSDTERQLLAITDEECARLKAALDSIRTQHDTWAREHIQRGEPSNAVLARYTLPAAEPEFVQSLETEFSSGILNALGEERGRLLFIYSSGWAAELGLTCQGPSTLEVTRTTNQKTSELQMELLQGFGRMRCGITPQQDFPGAFLPAFPGGWRDLAQREGFDLPESFQNE